MIPPQLATGDRRILWIARLLPMLISAFEVRSVLVHLAHVAPELERTEQAYLHSVVPWIITLLACGAVWMLRETGRGLAERISPPRWSTSLIGLWLVCSAVFVLVLCGQELCRALVTLGHSGRPPSIFGSAAWSSLPTAALVGCALSASLHGAGWVLAEVQRRQRGRVPSWPRAVVSVGTLIVVLRAVAAPVLSGWSDRGPPVAPARMTA